MLGIVVVDLSATARSNIAEKISTLLAENSAEQVLLPQLNIKQLSRQELKFHSKPDICIIGDQLIARELCDVTEIRRTYPDVILLAFTTPQLENLFTIEQLARCGVDDTISSTINSAELRRKIILLCRKAGSKKSGKLLVVSGAKGGVGSSTIAAGIAEALIDQKQKVALIDLDFETQDLSRFLQVRPFINENLQLLFDQVRPVTQEFVEQCLIRVWHDEQLLYCMPPIAESEDLFDARASYVRILISLLEVLDSCYDYVIIDSAAARGVFLNALYRTADQVLLVINNDPAALYAALTKVNQVRAHLAPGAELLVVENGATRGGLSEKLLRQEFFRAAKIQSNQWLESPVPFCRAAGRWPGSGSTCYSQGGRSLKMAFNSILIRLGISGVKSVSPMLNALTDLWRGWLEIKRAHFKGNELEHPREASPFTLALEGKLARSQILADDSGNLATSQQEIGLLRVEDFSTVIADAEDFDARALVSGVKEY